MNELLGRMQGSIHSAMAHEERGFSGTIPWRTVQTWIPLVEDMQAEILRLRQQLAVTEGAEEGMGDRVSPPADCARACGGYNLFLGWERLPATITATGITV